jgi:hypothetical protein
MKHVGVTDSDVPPSDQPGVDAAIQQLEGALRQLLGAATTYVLVIAQDRGDALHVQAVTDTSPEHAMHLLNYAQASGFEGTKRRDS